MKTSEAAGPYHAPAPLAGGRRGNPRLPVWMSLTFRPYRRVTSGWRPALGYPPGLSLTSPRAETPGRLGPRESEDDLVEALWRSLGIGRPFGRPPLPLPLPLPLPTPVFGFPIRRVGGPIGKP